MMLAAFFGLFFAAGFFEAGFFALVFSRSFWATWPFWQGHSLLGRLGLYGRQVFLALLEGFFVFLKSKLKSKRLLTINFYRKRKTETKKLIFLTDSKKITYVKKSYRLYFVKCVQKTKNEAFSVS